MMGAPVLYQSKLCRILPISNEDIDLELVHKVSEAKLQSLDPTNPPTGRA